MTPGYKFDYDRKDKLVYEHDGTEPPQSVAFKYQVTDLQTGDVPGGKTSEPATVTLAIRPVNDNPVWTAAQDTAVVSDTFSVVLDETFFNVNDLDSDDENITFLITDHDGLDQGWIYINTGTPDAPVWKEIERDEGFTLADVKAGRILYEQKIAASDANPTDSIKFVVVDNAVSRHWDANGNDFRLPGGVYDGPLTPGSQLQELTLTIDLKKGAGPGGDWTPPGPRALEIDAPDTDWAGYNWEENQAKTIIWEKGSTVAGEEKSYVILGDGSSPNTAPGLKYKVIDTNDSGADVTPAANLVVYTIIEFGGSSANTVSGELNGSLLKYVGLGDPATDTDNWVQLHRFGTFTQDDLNKGKIKFEHDGGEDFHSSVKFSVSSDLDVAPWTPEFHFYVRPVNDAPVAIGSDEHLVLEGYREGNPIDTQGVDRSFYITREHLRFTDPDDADSSGDFDGLENQTQVGGVDNKALNNKFGGTDQLTFTVTDLPDNGQLQYWDGSAWVEVTAATILRDSWITDAGNNQDGSVSNGTRLRYVHDGDELSRDDFFKVVAEDRWGKDSNEAEVKFVIAPVNDIPEIQQTPNEDVREGSWPQGGGTNSKNVPISGIIEGANNQKYYPITAENLQAIDADSNATQVQYRVTTAPAEGTLYRQNSDGSYSQIGVNGAFSQQEVLDGKIFYGNHRGAEPDGPSGSINGVWNPPHDKFIFAISDGSGQETAREFWIYVDPSNDRPVVTPGTTAPLVIPNGTGSLASFNITDPDSTGGIGTFDNFVQVTVRISDANGNPLSEAEYAAINITLSSPGVTAIDGHDGNQGALRFQGTLAEVNAVLDALTVSFGTGQNINEFYRVDVIVDDRLRDANGALILDGENNPDANGGQNLNNARDGLEAPSQVSVDPYTTPRADIDTSGRPLYKNVDIDHRTIFISNVNDAPTANPDRNEVTEKLGVIPAEEFDTALGNVKNGPTTDSPRDRADTDPDKTDTIVVTGVVAGNDLALGDGGVGQVIEGQYGWLTLYEDGSYKYTLNNNHPSVKALTPDSPLLEDVFSYKIKDDNTSNDPAGAKSAATTLTIEIKGVVDAAPEITTTGDDTVSETGLPTGTAAGSNSHIANGNIIITADAGISGLEIEGTLLSLTVLENLETNNYSIETDKGTLVLKRFVPESNPDAVLSKAYIEYEYTLKNDQPHGTADVVDEFDLKVVDASGGSKEGTLGILIEDDAPIARNDTASIREDNPVNTISGNIVTGTGAGNQAADTIGADGAPAGGPVDGFTFKGVSQDLGQRFKTEYGWLTLGADGEWTYELDNSDYRVNELQEGDTLTEEVVYTIKDSDGDPATATLTITIEGNTDGNGTGIGIVGHTSDVKEHALLTEEDRGEFTSGTFSVEALDGIRYVEIGGEQLEISRLEDLENNPLVIVTKNGDGSDRGKLTITKFDGGGYYGAVPTTGVLHYEYELLGPQYHDQATGKDDVFADVVPISVTEAGRLNRTASGELKINIHDDEPEARNDQATVREDDVLKAEGNVLDNDSFYADGPAAPPVVKVQFDGNDFTPGDTIITKYGQLVLSDDGQYVYTLNNSSPIVQDLAHGQVVNDVFTYTIRDADGDESPADLVIRIIGEGEPAPDPIKPEEPRNKAPEVIQTQDLVRRDVDNRAIVPLDISQYFSDPEGEALTYEVYGLPALLQLDPLTGKITGAPHHRASQFGPNGDGVYNVTVIAIDPHGEKASIDFKWTIVNLPPYAENDVAWARAGETVNGNVILGDADRRGRDSDPDGDGIVVTHVNNSVVASAGTTVTGSKGGTFTLHHDGSYTFNPGNDFKGLGTDATVVTSVTYVIADTDGGAARATLSVTVAGADVVEPVLPPVTDGAIIPTSERLITLYEPEATRPDGTASGTAGHYETIDELHSAFSVRLGISLENVVLTGARAADVWDNEADNVIYGNAAANTVFVSGGRDVVDGGAGYDLLVLSGARADYTFDLSGGVARITNAVTSDVVTAANIEAVSFNGEAIDPVQALYEAYYGRAATEAEYASATTLLKDGVSVADVAAKLAATPESQAHVGSGSGIDFVKSVYGAVLGRGADDAEAAWWAGRIEDGEFSRAEAVTRFLDSDEFADRYVSLFLTDHSDIFGLYRIVLGRDPDKDGFAFWSQRSAEGETLRDIAEDFYYSDEFQARIGSTSHEDLVRSFYVDLLGREPEEEGFNFWVGQLANDERSAANVAQSILESDEFRENIDTLLNRNDWLDVL